MYVQGSSLALPGGERFPVGGTVSRERRRNPTGARVTVTKSGRDLWLLFRAMWSTPAEDRPPEQPPPDRGSAPRRDSGEGVGPPLGPLPSGRHRYSPEQVARHQRERLIAGLAAAVEERGYAATTVGGIAAAAHVSRRVFYAHFETKEQCFLAAFDAVFDHLRGLMAAAAAAEPLAGDWPRQAIAALRVALEFFAAEPALARLCLVEAPGVGPAMRRRIGEIARMLEPFMAMGRALPGAKRELPDSTESSVIGALGFKFNRQVIAAGPESLPAQLPAYAEFLLVPYLGAKRARELTGEVAP